MRRPGRLGRLCAGLVLAAVVCSAAARAATEQITVFAAASLHDALEAVIDAYPLRDDSLIVVSYASSGVLARQIAAGAPAHLYVSANRGWVDWLEESGALADGSAVAFLHNRLVLIQPTDDETNLSADERLSAALTGGRLGLADPDHAPAGVYARQALESLGIWQALEGRLARFADVRATVAWVARGELAAGIVYESDAIASPQVRIAGRFDPGLHSPINYFLALVQDNQTPEAEAFYRYLRSPLAAGIFERHGFLLD